jgi:hypothetical protein
VNPSCGRKAAISWKNHKYPKGIFGSAQREKESRWEKSILAFAGTLNEGLGDRMVFDLD